MDGIIVWWWWAVGADWESGAAAEIDVGAGAGSGFRFAEVGGVGVCPEVRSAGLVCDCRVRVCRGIVEDDKILN